MRFRFLVSCFAAAWCMFASASPSSAQDRPRVSAQEVVQGFRDRVVLAKPRRGVDAQALRAAERNQRADLARVLGDGGVWRMLSLQPGDDPRSAARRLEETGLYEYVEPDYLRRRFAIPNDPRFPEQWYLENSGQEEGAAGADINATAAWDRRTSAADVIVAVLDSGVRSTHEDLAANMWRNAGEVPNNGLDDDNNGYVDDVHGINSLIARNQPGSGDPFDDVGHGTAVASVIGAVGNNGVGVTGVAWRTQLMALKFDDVEGTTDGSSYVSNVIECLEYAHVHGAKVINISYGGTYYSWAEYEALRLLGDAGIIIVVAAGNDGLSNDLASNYPASYSLPTLLAVANSDRQDQLSASSTYGGRTDLAAPGTAILACNADSDTGYELVNGTSFAAPAVAGAVALLRAEFPDEPAPVLVQRLLRSADRIPAFTGQVAAGGRLNLARAFELADLRPYNDDFNDRAELRGEAVITRANSAAATKESGEADHGAPGGASLWWSWTAPSSGAAHIDTNGSDFDTLLAVYSGSADALQLISLNQDAVGRTTSRLTFNATEGTTYQIAVDGNNGATGMVTLAVSMRPARDSFLDAEGLSGVADQTIGNNVNATRQPGEPDLVSGEDAGEGSTVWYRWTAPRTNYFSISIQSESFNPIVGVFQGPNVSSLTEVAVSTEAVSFWAVANTTYFIAVDSIAPAAGTFTLSLLEADLVLPFGGSVAGSAALSPVGAFAMLANSGFLLYFDQADRFWFLRLPGECDVQTPAFGPDGTIYVTTTQGLFAVSPDQERMWEHRFPGGASSSPAIGADGTIYVHGDDGWLRAYTPAGVERWRTEIPGASYSSPALGADGLLVLGSENGHLYGIDAVSGAERWKLDTGDGVFGSPALDANDTSYVGNLKGDFIAISAAGQELWRHSTGGPITSSAAIGPDGSVYFGGYDKKLYALTSTGTLRWSYETGDEIRASSPAIDAQGVVYIGSYDGSLYAINQAGALLQEYPTGGEIRSSALVGQQSLIWGSGDGNIYFGYLPQPAASSAWPMFRQNAGRTGRRAAATLPVIKAQPVSVTTVAGQSVTLAVEFDGEDPLQVQWYRNGVAIAGATSHELTISSLSPVDAGAYRAEVKNGRGAVFSSVATITVQGPFTGDSRLVNLSARAVAGVGAQTLIVGFVIGGGDGEKPLFVRGVGPTLGGVPFLVPGVLADPTLTLYSGGNVVQTNDNWGGGETLQQTANRVGAFSLSSGSSQDAALLTPLAPGNYSAHIAPREGQTGGVALAEFYDAGENWSSGQSRLINISARSNVSSGANALIVGFVIEGNAPRRLLVRGVGPTMLASPFSVPDALPDPQIEVYASSTLLHRNNDWSVGNDPVQLTEAARQVGAFALQAQGKDAALLLTLNPGAYSIVLTDAGNQVGVALAEVYEVP